MTRETVARWRAWDGEGVQHVVLREDGAGVVAEAVTLSGGGGVRFATMFRIACDARWRVRRAEVRVMGGGGVMLEADGAGRWLVDSVPSPALDGAVDIDLPVTPFTNTLPIRRLELAEGQSADIVTAYVEMPSLSVVADPQRYTCLEPRRRYRYESLDSDFRREITTDAEGLVLDYPGLFRRIP